MENNKAKKAVIFCLILIIGMALGLVVYFFTDIHWVKLVTSVSVIIISIIIALKSIVTKKG